MDRVSSLSKKALVGKSFYTRFHKAQLVWMQDFWKLVLGYCTRFGLLSNHWFIFHFLAEEDLLKILNSPWIINRGVIMIKHWVLEFNPLSESFKKRLLWMLPDFLIELCKSLKWLLILLRSLFLRSLRWVNKRTASVLVELDLDSGLADSITVTVGEYSFCQLVDFWREPFHCNLCGKTGHLKASCSLDQSVTPLTTVDQDGNFLPKIWIATRSLLQVFSWKAY